MSEDIVKYNCGEYKKVAFVFSCPGYEEEENKKVVSGQTGENLELVIKVLNKLCPDVFPEIDRYKYTITNASQIVHYTKKDNRTEPKTSEVKDKNNIERLRKELENAEYIIVFGVKAQMAINNIKFVEKGPKIINSMHLSNRNINARVKFDKNSMEISAAQKGVNGTIKQQRIDNKRRRIEKIAEDIYKGIIK